MPDYPAHVRIAAELRAQIMSGQRPPGAKLPSQGQLHRQHGVSLNVARKALDSLQAEGLIERRAGSGNYVRSTTRLVRRAHARDMRQASRSGAGSPFASDAAAAGMRGRWEHRSQHATATAGIAQRLGIAVGDPVMVTRYRFLADDLPIQLSESHEPLAITSGTPVEWPEDGAAVGVVSRMDVIGVRIDRSVERVLPRPATPEEVELLDMDPRGGLWVLAIERTYYAGQTAVETADIVLRADRYQVVYETPID